MKYIALLVVSFAAAGLVSADQFVVGGTQSVEGFPFYGC